MRRSCALPHGESKRSLRAALEQLNVVFVHEDQLLSADPARQSFIDLDTPADLATLAVGRKT